MIAKAIEVTRRYHDTWNGRDADAVVGSFTKDGTFCNPETYPGISGEALAAFVSLSRPPEPPQVCSPRRRRRQSYSAERRA
jgi:nuclear transport factor 2 (NTF2) superfamily protein